VSIERVNLDQLRRASAAAAEAAALLFDRGRPRLRGSGFATDGAVRILATGGAGFLGSHLCERLRSEGHEVVCLDNLTTGSRSNVAHLHSPGFELVVEDVARSLWFDVQQIYHLACPASPVHYTRDRVGTIVTATQGTLNMLRLAHALGARLLIASTSEVYGDPEEHPQRESYWGNVNPIGERACYDEGKRCAEALAASYALQYGVDVRIVRIFNTYGPRMDVNDGRVVSNLVTQALRGEPMTIYGDGTQTRSFCFVSDLIEGLVRVMNLESDPGPVNLGNPEELQIRELAELVRSASGTNSPISWRPLPADDPVRRRPDISKARKVLNWHPEIGIGEGLERTIEYFSERLQQHQLGRVVTAEPRNGLRARRAGISPGAALTISLHQRRFEAVDIDDLGAKVGDKLQDNK
jgi:UDP-glucuronate decarboxylase